MAHFAKIENNTVTQVIVIDNSRCPGPLVDSEPLGVSFITDTLGLSGTWKQTSYNANFRNKFTGIGDLWDDTAEVFYPASPYPSWTLDTNTWTWSAPVAYPADGNDYNWNENTLSWDAV